MRRAAKLLPALAALFFLGACAATAEAAAFGDAADDLRWIRVVDDGRVELLFGVPDSDEILFGLSCRGANQVAFTSSGELGEVDEPTGERLVLASGDQTKAVTIAAAGGDALALDEPLVAAFRRTGRLGAAKAGARDALSAATAAEQADIAAFFSACAARA